MKLLKNVFAANQWKSSIFFVAVLAIFLAGCGSKGGSTPLTLLELLSKTWRISKVTINGTVDNTGNYSAFRVAFQQNGTYVVTLGNSPINIVINPSNNGRWAITDNETSITFDQGTSNEYKVTIPAKPSESVSTFSVRFKVPRTVNKTEPEYIIEFVAVN
jgi:hypothetical protein